MNLSLLLYVLFGILGLIVVIPTAIHDTLEMRDRHKNSQGSQAHQQAPVSGVWFSRVRNLPLLLPLLVILLTASGVFNVIQQTQIATLTNQVAILNQRLSHTPTVPSPTPTATPTPTPTPLYQANWSSSLNGWKGGSEWSVNNGMLVNNGTNTDLSGQSNFSIVAPFHPQTANYAVEVQIQFLGQFSSSKDYLFGIMLRVGAAMGYLCYIYDGNLARIKIASGGIIQYAFQLPIDMSWHMYRAVVNNNLITFFRDNALIGEVLDSTYTAPGVVGLVGINSQINVRSFAVFPTSS